MEFPDARRPVRVLIAAEGNNRGRGRQRKSEYERQEPSALDVWVRVHKSIPRGQHALDEFAPLLPTKNAV
jgi:hypothetical protein